MPTLDSYQTRGTLTVGNKTYTLHRLAHLPNQAKLPFSLKILLENLLRFEDGRTVEKSDIEALLHLDPTAVPEQEIAFRPARVLLQDFTGVPAIVDLAAMRDAITKLGGDPQKINPLAAMDLVIDHSVQVDHFGASDSLRLNTQLEYQRNQERYSLLRWGQQAFRGFRVVPPGTGICHQVNLEYLAPVVFRNTDASGETMVYPDSLVGTDSHTTMINGLGVLGWGVGGIEAEAAMLGQPVSMLIPHVVGFRLHGRLREGATATDLVLTVTQMLRKKGVVGKFVEFFGPGLAVLPLPDRATIANMAPEYGATMGFFPVDDETIAYLRLSGRSPELIDLVKAYCTEQGLYRTAETPDPSFADTLELDLATVEPSLAGPKRPQDRVPLGQVRAAFQKGLAETVEKGSGPERLAHKEAVTDGTRSYELGHGAVIIAAITSCTNTSNPAVMLGAGLVAQKAVARGLTVKPWVKTSLAPGSRVVTEYLKAAGVLTALDAIGFNLVGYGCTTCIGNSGPLPEPVAAAITKGDLVVASVLSGNRNFEGRVHPLSRQNFLASPMLVVAYALAGTLDIDLQKDPLGLDHNNVPVYLADIWPTGAELSALVGDSVKSSQFVSEYAKVFDGDATWQKLAAPTGQIFEWDPASTYVRNPPFFENLPRTPAPVADLVGARVLLKLGDSVTTDHISPAGDIDKKGPAAKYLVEHGVKPVDFNSYGARRGNHEVMMRGTFANIRIKNQLAPGTEGGVTQHLPDGTPMSVFDAAMAYQAEGVPSMIIAGAEYGTGSSRHWAAKGPRLLGIRAVIAKSFERIHRSNLVGMGVLPCQFLDGEDAETLGLSGRERYSISGIADGIKPGKRLQVVAVSDEGKTTEFTVICRIDTPNEVDYYRHGGILSYVLRQLVAK